MNAERVASEPVAAQMRVEPDGRRGAIVVFTVSGRDLYLSPKLKLVSQRQHALHFLTNTQALGAAHHAAERLPELRG